jgi:hypothetical protein
MALILVLRRDSNDLSTSEMLALKSAFNGEQLRFLRTDPADYQEHAANCRYYKPDAVLLPLERPIPSQAMEEGIRHIVVRGDETFALEPLVPNFKPFIYKSE